MRVVIFTHSLVSDWNHGNAHFLRGIALELLSRGIDVRVFEPADGWSRRNLVAEEGPLAVEDFERAFPSLRSELYDLEHFDLDHALDEADIVLVHEWNDPLLVRRIGEHRSTHSYSLLFHDTHHRSVTDPVAMSAYDLRHYDGVLAYGTAIAEIYQKRGWAQAVWTWHEAADVRTFRPIEGSAKTGDVVWIGNWGDGERSDELREFFIRPVKQLGLKASAYGVRYPDSAIAELEDAGIEYKGWIANYRVPEIFAQHRVTVHIPRGPYARQLPGIPTIRPFEAMACGIPLISAPWQDKERLFRPGDYAIAKDGDGMTTLLKAVLSKTGFSESLSRNGLETVRRRHTCAHRVDELLVSHRSLEGRTAEGQVVLRGAA